MSNYFFPNESQDTQLARQSVSLSSRKAAREFHFSTLCNFLNDHEGKVRQKEFDELIRKFNNTIDVSDETPEQKKDAGQSYSPFLLVRLLIPTFDRRKPYMTPRYLRKLLENFVQDAFPVKELSAEEYAKFVSKNYPGTSKGLTIDDINKELDSLAFDRPKRAATMEYLCKHMSSVELKWFFYLLFKEISDKIVGQVKGASILLNYLSPKARQLYQAGVNLMSICIGAFQAGDSKEAMVSSVILGKPVLPMLLAKITCDEEGTLKIIKHCGRPFYLETKYDGEHFLVHRICGENYSYFTRKGNDYSKHFGVNSSSGFSARLHPCFLDDVEQCVLDCELVVWDRENKRIHGKNRETETRRVMDVKFLEDNDPRFQRAIVVLDVLLLNHESYFDEPLEKRLEILKTRVFKDNLDSSTIQISKQIECSKIEQFRNFYTEHLKNGEEGIVIKGKNTTYHFGERMARHGWFKVKPDYGARLTLDLAVVGVRYENMERQKFRSFLVAALTNDEKYRIIGGIQASLKKTELERLFDQLQVKEMGLEQCPVWLEGYTNNRTTLYVNWECISVVEVKASGLINGKLQFPAITGLRLDKFNNEISLYSEVMSYEGKLRERKRFQPQDFFVLQRTKRRRAVLAAGLSKSAAILRKKYAHTQLKGIRVVVFDDTPKRKLLDQCRLNVRELGAELVENYVDGVKFAVSVNPKGLTTKAYIQKDVLHIVSGSWVQRCVDAKKILPWQEDEMIHNCVGAEFDLFTVNDEGTSLLTTDQDQHEDQPAVVPTVQQTTATEQPMNEVETAVERELLIDQTPDAEIQLAVKDEYDDRLQSYAVDGEPFVNDDEEDDATRSTTSNGIIGAFDRQSLEDEFPAPEDDALFDGLQFYSLGHTSATMDAEYKKKILTNGGALVDQLDDRITHLFFEEKYDFDADPHELMPWLTKHQWTWVFTNRHWVDRALEEKERYLEPVPILELKI
ncbi:DNA ligase IV [Aphelenchoides besseyi]|nr:DNA ligase IV [Aphelenchoides besseyi]